MNQRQSVTQSPRTADDPTGGDGDAVARGLAAELERLVTSEAYAAHRALSEREAEIAALLRDRDVQAAEQARYRAVQTRLLAALLRRQGLRGWLRRHVTGPRRMTAALRQSELFVPDWYLERHPEAGRGPAAAIRHYLAIGSYAGADPGPGFDTMAYYTANPDVAEAGWPALAHYLIHGRAEGRLLRWSAPDA